MIKKIILGAAFATTWIGGVHVIAALCAEARPSTVAVSDRPVARPSGAECDAQVWPYYSSTCMKNIRGPGGGIKEARVVTADRLPSTHATTLATK
jgi:hypothetical protein